VAERDFLSKIALYRVLQDKDALVKGTETTALSLSYASYAFHELEKAFPIF